MNKLIFKIQYIWEELGLWTELSALPIKSRFRVILNSLSFLLNEKEKINHIVILNKYFFYKSDS
jgi:hypothetical protein